MTALPSQKQQKEMDVSNSTRLAYQQQSPDLMKKLVEFGTAIDDSGQIDRGLQLLIDLRASQMNGCAFCVDIHVKEAKLNGERELRLHHVAIWRESSLFTAKERAAFAWTEALTEMESHGVSDELYAEASQHFGEKELSALTFCVARINAWNRLNVAFRTKPGIYDTAFGLDKAGLA